MSDLLQFYEKDFRKCQDLINKNVEKIYDYLSSKSKKEYNISVTVVGYYSTSYTFLHICFFPPINCI